MDKNKKEPLYTLNIFHQYNEKTYSNDTIFLIQTIRMFTNFRYEILLEDKVDDGWITMHIKGLHIPAILIPQTGPAQAKRIYKNLDGIYRIIVTKQDKAVNEFIIYIDPKTIEIKEKSKNPFILISDRQVDLTLG